MQQPIFTALADPLRRQLLVNLAEQSPKTATRLAQDYPKISRQGILKHLNVLAAAGLVTTQRAGREQRYSLTPEPLAELEQWVRDLEARWDARLMRLKDFVES